MGNFKREFGGGKRFSGRDDGRPDMHKATCSECGAGCEVPFRPTGERPVFCSDCFKNQGSGGGRSNKFSDKRRDRSGFGDRQRYDVVCAKCGRNCQVPFKPTAGKSVFCDDCFKQDGGGGKDKNKDSGEIMRQINLLNAKIDNLIKILTPKAPIEKIEKPKVKKVKIAAKKTSAKNKKKK